jgi:adenylate cyclase
VNRPLKASDSKQENQNHTDYGNQVNKVANAIKELLTAMASSEPAPTRAQGIVKANPGKRWVTIAVAVVAVIAGGIYFFSLQNRLLANDPERNSIAVLAFADMSSAKDQEHLGDGMAEEILNDLAGINGLRVIGRTSSFSFKGKNVSLREIGEALGVSTILEGSVQKSGNRIRITAQLINAADETHIWSEQYERDQQDIFAIQDEIADMILSKLKSSFDTKSQPREKGWSPGVEAYELFLKARQYQRAGVEWQNKALEMFEKAIALEPQFAEAYSELALTYWTMGLHGIADQAKSKIKAKEAATKAIELDNQSAKAYNMLAYLNLTMDWDIRTYKENFEKAVSLGLPLPDLQNGQYKQFIEHKHEEALREARQIVANDPLSVDAYVHLSRINLYARNYDEVLEVGKRALALSPDQSSVLRHSGEALFFTGRYEEALPYFTRLMEKNPYYSPHNIVAVYVKLGKREIAAEIFEKYKANIAPGKRCMCYIYLGEKDKALEALEEACRVKDLSIFGISVDPHFDSIRNDPKYQQLARCVI